MIKSGANFEDQNAIRHFLEEGINDPDKIGSRLNLKPAVIKNFIHSFYGQAGFIEDDEADEADEADEDDSNEGG